MQVENEKANVSSQPEQQLYWWIAINGASAAMSPMPMPQTLRVVPTPQQLIGFENYKAAKVFQTTLLTAPIPEVKRELMALRVTGDAVFINPDNPAPPTKGATMWFASDDAEVSDAVEGSLREQYRRSDFAADKLFQPGQIVATPAALAAIEATGTLPDTLFVRHLTGDWGNLCADDVAMNEAAVANGRHILSEYQLDGKTKIWIITDADRLHTTILLPDEY
jgi:hypothetical protein